MPANAPTCSDAKLYNSLVFCEGKTLNPGVRSRIFAISKKDIVSWPTLPATATSKMGEYAAYEGNFTLAADKKFIAIDVIDTKGNVSCASQGEKPSKTFNNTYNPTIPTTAEEATALAAILNAGDFVFVVITRDGKARVLGNEMFQTNVDVTQSLGEGYTPSDAGTQLNIAVTDVMPAPFYPGDIVTEDGTYSGETGKKKSS